MSTYGTDLTKTIDKSNRLCKIFCAGLNPDGFMYLWCHPQLCSTTVTNSSSHSGIVVDLSHTQQPDVVSAFDLSALLSHGWKHLPRLSVSESELIQPYGDPVLRRGAQTGEQVTSLVENLTPETELIRKLKIQWEKQDSRFTPPSCAPQSTCALVISWLVHFPSMPFEC